MKMEMEIQDWEQENKSKKNLNNKGKFQTTTKSLIYVTILENYRQMRKSRKREISRMPL